MKVSPNMKKEDKNYKYFKKEEENLKKKYVNEFIIIYNEDVVFHDKDLNKVIDYARQLEAGKYIIQNCDTNETNNIQMFHTRVTF